MKLILATSKFCGPCHLLKRRLNDENIEVDTIDMEENIDAFRQYNIKGVPRLVVIEEDTVTESIQGVDDIIKKIKQHVKSKKESQ
jgi:glutaredoxin